MKKRRKMQILAYILTAVCTLNITAPAPASAQSKATENLSVQAANSTAETYQYGDFTYEVSASGTVTITDYTGKETSITVPSVIDGKTVTAIGPYVFGKGVTEVTIPESVLYIREHAFYFSYEFSKIIIKGKNTRIGETIFFSPQKVTFVCSSDSKAYEYARENKGKICLTDGIDLSAAVITPGKASIPKKDAPTEKIPVTVTLNGRTLQEGVDYTCTWPTDAEKSSVGTKTITIAAIDYNPNHYTGSKSTTYDVIPDASTDLRASKNFTASGIQLTWRTVKGSSGYYLYRYDASSKKYKQIAAFHNEGANNYKDTGLKKNTRYKYRIITYQNADGKSYLSEGTDLTAYTASKKTTVKKSKKAKIKTRKIKLKAKVKTENYPDYDAQVSAISDFFDSNGKYTIAYSDAKYVYISTLNNKSLKITKTIKIKKKYKLVGSVTCGPDGNYYIVWGQRNWKAGNVTLAVSKYDKKGRFIKSCESYNTGDNMDTATPFFGGNCAVTFQRNVLVCSYARQMMNVHQSNAVFCVNINDMSQNTSYDNYASHSFDQRVLALANGDVVFANLGDGNPRGFYLAESGPAHEWDNIPFHFYGNYGANHTYARLGGIGEVSTGIALVGSSAPSLTKKATREKMQLFIQIISPVTHVSVFKGSKRSGTVNGSPRTDTGVKWLTNYKNASVSASSIAVMEKDRILVLWEKNGGGKITSYYTVISPTGKVLQKATKIGNLKLNECEEIKYKNGCIYWTTADGKKRASVHKLYIGKFK